MKVVSTIQDNRSRGTHNSLKWVVTIRLPILIPGTSSLTMAMGWVPVAAVVTVNSSNNNSTATALATTLEENTIIKVRVHPTAEGVKVVAVAVVVDSVNSLTDLITRLFRRAPST